MPLDRIKQAWRERKYKVERDLTLITHLDRFECINEDQSVKWNREEIVKRNEQADLQIQRYNIEDDALLEQMRSDCCTEMIQDYRFQQKLAERIYDFLYSITDTVTLEFFDRLESLAQLIASAIPIVAPTRRRTEG